MVQSNELYGTHSDRLKFTCASLLISFTFGCLFGSGFRQSAGPWLLTLSSSALSPKSKPMIPEISFDGYNSTHLWSMAVADDNYLRLARLIPCRTVVYTGGPKSDPVNTCDHSSTNEYSLGNSLKAQKWLYEHQHPTNCSNKRFAIIEKFAWSGFGSTVHQITWAFGMALAEDRIAVYRQPGDWLYAACPSLSPDCFFLPISNCTVPSTVDGNRTKLINANFGHWHNPVHHPVFRNRSFNWYRSQMLFYLMRFNPQTLANAQKSVAQYFRPPSVDEQRPYIAVYVRRSDKVVEREMSQAYSLRQYFDLFDDDARRANISSVYINSEDEQVYKEFATINAENNGYYKLLTVNATRNVVYLSFWNWTKERRASISLEFLTDLYIEVNADLHVGTLTSNWCRLVDEMRLVLGKFIAYYTPENRYLSNFGKRRRRR